MWDGRSVNKALESDAFMIPRVEGLIDRIARLKWDAQKLGYSERVFSGIDQRKRVVIRGPFIFFCITITK